MASVPNSSHRGARRLAELLEEQQEPFLLDDYLIENGYSTRMILSSQPSIMCWPGGRACRRLQRLSSSGFKRRRGGFLRSVLTKFVYGKSIRRAFNWGSKAPGSGSLSVFDCFSEMGSKTHAAERGISSDSGAGTRESGGRHRWRCNEVVEDSEQLSPVSVLGLHSDCGSPFHSHSIEEEEEESSDSSLDSPSSNIFEEMLESAFCTDSPQYGKPKRELGQLDQLLLDCVREVEDRIWGDHGLCLGSEMAEGFIQEQVLSWERQKGDCSINQLVGSDLSSSRKDWSQFQPQVREIGIEIEAAIFEDIREETILGMLGFHCT